ncbi:hypothetical protein DMH03_08395 [Amycolatopsis sp. WAC 01376]|uniref:hypothetical protein n=1 Tax=Amycolatopsis sp. WAC 01376 TaxID=2203195 RepID=UPI000F799E12|nr:hypothetical protein [Amycolatopsis sp. WAC 01376]RSM67067.1 hypothetical protein DMH03_08395 [Amycolatopsis sp. WAC 01376]
MSATEIVLLAAPMIRAGRTCWRSSPQPSHGDGLRPGDGDADQAVGEGLTPERCLGVKALFFRKRAGDVTEPAGRGIRSGFLINVSNPKAGVFAVSFLLQIVARLGWSHAWVSGCAAIASSCGWSARPAVFWSASE